LRHDPDVRLVLLHELGEPEFLDRRRRVPCPEGSVFGHAHQDFRRLGGVDGLPLPLRGDPNAVRVDCVQYGGKSRACGLVGVGGGELGDGDELISEPDLEVPIRVGVSNSLRGRVGSALP